MRKLQTTISAVCRPYRGAPTIFINGNPIAGSAVAFREKPWRLPSLRKTRPDFGVVFTNFIDADPEDDAAIHLVEERLRQMFRNLPKIRYGGCVLSLQPSCRWTQTHPHHLPVYDRPVDWERAWHHSHWREASWASLLWQQDAARFLEKLVIHLQRAFSGRVIYCQFGAGCCGENCTGIDPYGNGSWFCGDFSAPMLERFRQDLRQRYDNSVKKLRHSWGQNDVDFDHAFPPNRAERLQSEWFSLRSPLRSQTADYYRTLSEAIEDCVMAWATAIKRASKGNVLTATGLGSILDAGLHAFNIHSMAKTTFLRATRHPDLDMLQSPSTYAMRDPACGDTTAMIPLGTLRLHGKIWARDLDSRTSLAGFDRDHPTGSLWRTPATLWEDHQILIRDAAYSLIKGGTFWWHEIHDGMFKLSAHTATVRRLHAVGRGVVHADHSTMPGLGVFVDDEAIRRQSSANRLLYAMNYEPRQIHWFHSGMAGEIYHLDDALHPAMPRHRVLMVTNGFAMSDRQVETIQALACKNRAVLIWIMAPGVQAKDGFNLEKASRITGFRLRAANVEALPRLTPIPSSHRWAGHLKCFGAGLHDYDDSGARAVGPVFFAVPRKGDTVLATLDSLNRPGLLIRKNEQGLMVAYCAAPYLPAFLLHLIGKEAGAHLYMEEGDSIHVTRQLLLIHARQAGEKRIHWPTKIQVVLDLITGKPVAANTRSWRVNLLKAETRFFFAGDQKTAIRVRSLIRPG